MVTRQFFDDFGNTSPNQVCIPKHLRRAVFHRIHNSPAGGQIGVLLATQEFHKIFFFPGFTELVADFMKDSLSCTTPKCVNKKQMNPPLQLISSEQLVSGNVLQIDLIGRFQPPINKYALSGNDVSPKYQFAVPPISAHAANVAKALNSKFFHFNYMATTHLSDLEKSFVANLRLELTDLLKFQLQHASLKHPQTIRVDERSLSALKRILKLKTEESWTKCCRYVDLATSVVIPFTIPPLDVFLAQFFIADSL